MTVLTGFLGAGKTTLLNRLLRDTALAETAVIINEFGEAPLDHLLVEYVGDNMVLLQSGCLCCTMRGDLVDALETLLRDLDNRRCKFRRVLLETTGATKGEATPNRLLGSGLYDPDKKIPDVKKWLAAEAYAGDHHHSHDANRHDEHIGSFVLTTDEAISAGTLEMFLELLRATHGAKLLRIKGIVKLAEMPDTPVVVHGVQHVFHPTARLDNWPDDDHRARLVFITRDLPERTVRELFEAFLGVVAPDRPDRTALTDNPLIPFGGR
jgi:G3E family GTPase